MMPKAKPVDNALTTCHCCGKYKRVMIVLSGDYEIAICPRCDIIRPPVEE